MIEAGIFRLEWGNPAKRNYLRFELCNYEKAF